MAGKQSENKSGFAAYVKTFLKWVLYAGVIGIAVGILGSLFAMLINTSSGFFLEHNWIIWLLPAGGVLITLLYRWSKKSHDNGTDTVIQSVRNSDRIPAVMVPLIFISTLITRLFGGSVGAEGAAIQLGGGLSSSIGKWLHMNDQEEKIVIMCGISAGFSAVVGTPMTSIILAIELAGVGVMFYSAILPCTLSSIIAFGIAQMFHVDFPQYQVTGLPALDVVSCVQVILLAAMGGLVSILLCASLRTSKMLYQKAFPNKAIRAAAGGFIIVGLTYLVGSNLYNGDSLPLIGTAVANAAGGQEFLLKILFTVVTIGAGFKGGEIVPTLVIGATFGSFAGELMGLSPSFGAAIGLVSVFCGAINSPMTAFVIGIELFGANGALFYLIACALGYVCSGYFGLYPSQKIWFDKLSHKFIKKNAE